MCESRHSTKFVIGVEWFLKKFWDFTGERLQKRIELSRPVLEGFWAWVEETSAKYTTNESLKTVLTYTTNQKRYLETFLEDGRISISNNDCESCIRSFANGRKAWLFADSPKGAGSYIHW